jgi:hypothetical protein
MTERTAIVGMALLALVLAACGVGGGGGDTGRLAGEYLPRDVWAVGGMDVTGLRGTEYYEKAREQMEEALAEGGMLEEFQAAGIDIDSMSHAVFGIGGDPTSSFTTLVLFVLQGDFEGEKVLSLIRAKAEEEGDSLTETEIAGVSCLSVEGEDVVLSSPAAGVLVAGNTEAVRMGLEVNRSGKPSIEENEDIAAMMKTVDTGGNFWMAGKVPEQGRQMAGAFPMATALAQVKSFAFSTRLDDGVRTLLVGRFPDEDGAEQAKIQIQGLVQMAKGWMSMQQEDPGLTEDITELVDSLSIESSKTDLVLTLDIEKSLLDRLVARAEEMR